MMATINRYILTGEVYSDTGCHLQASCLSCSLPKCYYDMTPEEKGRYTRSIVHKYRRTREIFESFRGSGEPAGRAADKTATLLGVTSRTVYRRLSMIEKYGY